MTTSIKRWIRRLFLGLGLLVFLAAFGYWQLTRQLEAWGISDWHLSINDLSLKHLAFDRVAIEGRNQNATFQLTLGKGRVDWRWQGWQPKVERIDLELLVLDGDLPDSPTDDQDSQTQAWPLPDDWHLPDFLPSQLRIGRLQLGPQCAALDESSPESAETCWPGVGLELRASPSSAQASLALLDGPESARLELDYRVEAGLPRLDAQLSATGFVHLQGFLALAVVEAEGVAQRQWQMKLDAGLSRPDDNWQVYLRRWFPSLDTGDFDQLNSEWGFGLEGLSLRIDSALDAHVPAPQAFNQLPLTLELQTLGRPGTQLRGLLAIDTEVLSLSLRQAELEVVLDVWSSADIQASQMRLSQTFEADWRAGRVKASGTANIDIQSLNGEGWGLENLQLQLAQFSMEGDQADWRHWTLAADTQLTLGKLLYPDLHPLPWRWQGRLSAEQGSWQLTGELAAAELINLRPQLLWQEEELQLRLAMDDLFFLAGNSLKQLTPLWPELLVFERGRLGASADLRWQLSESLPRGQLKLRLNDLGGAYDTSVFVGASGELNVTISPENFALQSEKLQIKQVIYGFSLGPITAAGNYAASVAAPAQGRLQVTQLEGEVLKGRLQMQPTNLDLAKLPQDMLVELHEIDLAQLLAEHPSSDITGSGRLSGRLPLTLGEKGISLNEGRVAALAPGGELQYRSASASAMGESNAGMKIITEALNDFHYSVLASQVTYEESGRLVLGLRLEGNNPAVEGGRQINFNINLEEDLPALLASLQLSNQISDRIKKRVQDKLRQRQP